MKLSGTISAHADAFKAFFLETFPDRLRPMQHDVTPLRPFGPPRIAAHAGRAQPEFIVKTILSVNAEWIV
jgi:hypothetical protein